VGHFFILKQGNLTLVKKISAMKKFVLLLLLGAVVIGTGSGFQRIKPMQKFMKKEGFVFVPSGTVTIQGKPTTIQSFFMLAGEVTNKQYNAFLSDLQQQGKTAEYEIAKIVPEKWKLDNASMENMVKLYHVHESFTNYPVVNISQEGARLYCKWLEEKYNAAGYQVKVRLPLDAEWQYAAKGGNDNNIYAWSGSELRSSKGLYLANFKTEKVSDDGGYFTAITKSYNPNDYGLYNMCGNVSEWTSDDAMSKGGSWWSDPKYLKIDAPQEFGNSLQASPFIGFRPVITVTMN